MVSADVCIIGAGAAGLTLARELGTRLSVCVVESGTRRPAPTPDPRYDLISTELPVAKDSRVRALGGTTTTWSGRWKRLDPADLEAKAWVPHSGWPISYDELAPYYERADGAAGFAPASTPASPLSSPDLVPTTFRSQPLAQRDWGTASLDARVLVDHHVVQLAREGRAITRVVTDKATISARFVVLATGGIENARQLLLAELDPHDQVGRYYMDHPKARQGVIEGYDPIETRAWDAVAEDSPVYLGYKLTDELQREHRILNSHVLFQPLYERTLPARIAYRAIRPTHCRLLAVRNYLEQAPDPENRVFLHGDRDHFGLRKAAVRWTIGPLEIETMRVFHRVLQRACQRGRLGELESPLLHGGTLDLKDASHHMGTTRMGRDPRTSVVDSTCRVHELDNLYVAGSSVFPTSGYANPTATLCALAIRLADHLQAIA